MSHRWPRFARRIRLGGWWAILPTLLIVALTLLLTGATSASPAPASQPRVLLTDLLFQEQKPLCQSCHPKEYEDWKDTPHAKATYDPVFQEQLQKSGNQTACLSCHTTGFDDGSGAFLSEGVTCEACHGPYKEGHPNAATMQLPLDSDTCHVCHQDTFTEWQSSAHAANGIECFDCHMAHTQGLRLGSEEKLCAACHADLETQYAHATHGIEGVDCADCHMAQDDKASTSTLVGMPKPARSHTFTVASDVCAGCHKGTIHTAAPAASASNVALSPESNQTADATGQVSGLQKQIADLQQHVKSLRDVAVVSMGLSLGFGGFLGLLAGIILMTILRKRGER